VGPLIRGIAMGLLRPLTIATARLLIVDALVVVATQ
jgi:hypothetical protein